MKYTTLKPSRTEDILTCAEGHLLERQQLVVDSCAELALRYVEATTPHAHGSSRTRAIKLLQDLTVQISALWRLYE